MPMFINTIYPNDAVNKHGIVSTGIVRSSMPMSINTIYAIDAVNKHGKISGGVRINNNIEYNSVYKQ